MQSLLIIGILIALSAVQIEIQSIGILLAGIAVYFIDTRALKTSK